MEIFLSMSRKLSTAIRESSSLLLLPRLGVKIHNGSYEQTTHSLSNVNEYAIDEYVIYDYELDDYELDSTTTYTPENSLNKTPMMVPTKDRTIPLNAADYYWQKYIASDDADRTIPLNTADYYWQKCIASDDADRTIPLNAADYYWQNTSNMDELYAEAYDLILDL